MIRFIKKLAGIFLLLFFISGCMPQNPLSSLSSSQKDMEEIEASLSGMLSQLATTEKLLEKVQHLLTLLETQKKEQEKILHIAQEEQKWVTLSGKYNTSVYHKMRFMRQSFGRQGATIKKISMTSAALKQSLGETAALNQELKTQIQKAIELNP